MSNGSGTPKLNACGCCQAAPELSSISNRPGLSAISYRLATYAVFLERMRNSIHSETIPDGPNQGAHPLAPLTTRSLDDPAIALLDAGATVADVLTFYQERVANEGYLRTATERRSALEMARAIGYELSPGVAASVYLAFTVEDTIGAAGPAAPGGSAFNPGVVLIPQGTQVQSVPSQGALPQTFETSADFQARVEWNALQPRLLRHQDLAISGGKLYMIGAATGFPAGSYVILQRSDVFLLNPLTQLSPSAVTVPAIEVHEIYLGGITSNLKYGDRLLLVGSNGGVTIAQAFIVRNVLVEADQNRTRVDFQNNPDLPPFQPAAFPPATLTSVKVAFTYSNVSVYILSRSIHESDLQAFIQTNGWSARELAELVNTPRVPFPSGLGAFAFRSTAAFYGNNAQLWRSLPAPSPALRGDPYPIPWDDLNNGVGPYIWTDSQGNDYKDASAFLERSFPQVLPNSWTLLESPGLQPTPYRVTGVVEKSLADFGGSGKATGLKLDIPPDIFGYDYLAGHATGNPAVASWDHDRLDVFLVGWDSALYHKAWDTNRWIPGQWEYDRLGDQKFVGDPTVVSWDHDRLDVFMVGTDGSLWHKWWNGGWGPSPTAYENLGKPNGTDAIRGNPVVVSWGPNRLDVFVISSVNGALYHKWWNGSQWGPSFSGFEYMGGIIVGNPSVVSWEHDRLDVFVVGTDGALYHKWWNRSQWGPSLTGYENLGWPNGSDPIRGDPVPVSWGHDRLDVFVVNDADGALYHKWWDGSQWGPSFFDFEYMGGVVVGNPAVASWDHDRLDVFVVGTNGGLYYKFWTGSQWVPSITGYEYLGGVILGNPAVASWDHDRLDVFVIGTNHALYHKAWNGHDWVSSLKFPFPVRKTTAFIQSEQLALADLPIVDDIPAGTTELMLNEMVLGLTAGQAVAVHGERVDAAGVMADEILKLADVIHAGGFTVLQFTAGLQHGYLRSTVTINANLALATHGETVHEVLGDGDASQVNQSFALKRQPLTYVSAPTPSGTASTLVARVNDLAWQEAPALYGLTEKDQDYIVRIADDASATLTFGDPAARIRSGQQNITATYRTGIGLAGNVDSGSLALLRSRPPGLRGVTNPLKASGAADPQDLAHARTNAPLTVLTLDRIVSLDDYEAFTRAFAGVGKAQAVAIWSGEIQLVHITVAAANGDPIDPASPLFSTLLQAILLAHDPVQQVVVGGYQPLFCNLSAAILIDQPRYEPQIVMAAVASALHAALSFESRAFAQAVSAAEVVALIQSVPGVISTDLNQLYLTPDPSGPSQTEPPPFLPAAPARFESGAIQPAQLLLLNPSGAALTEMTS